MLVTQSLFLFLAAAVTAMFGFLSVVVYVSTPSKERQVRARLELLKTLAEQPGENAVRILEMLRLEDEEKAAKRELDARRDWINSGVCLVALGLGLMAMLAIIGDKGAWSVGLLLLFLGVGLLLTPPPADRKDKETNK
jgi:Domain of unknown function (DUF6249)